MREPESLGAVTHTHTHTITFIEGDRDYLTSGIHCKRIPSIIGKEGVARISTRINHLYAIGDATTGITLVALVVTIVALLILAGITIMYIMGDNSVFKLAQNAVEKWEDATKQEQEILIDIDKTFGQYTGEEQHNWERTGDNIKCNHCGLNFTIGDYIDYQPDKTNKKIIITKQESGLLENSIGSEAIDPKNVYDQEFIQDSETYWQVLGVEDSNKNGINETLLIKMVAGTNTELILKGTAAYNNGPEIMNKIAKELYSSSKYGEARSINIEDVNQTLQYTPTGGFYTSESDEDKELSGFDTPLKEVPTWEKIKEKGTYYAPDGTNEKEKLGAYKANSYSYSLNSDETGVINPATNAITSITENTRNLIFKTPTGNGYLSYWLASRGVRPFKTDVGFGCGWVTGGFKGVAASYAFFDSAGAVGGGKLSIVPVVPLKTNIPEKITQNVGPREHLWSDSTSSGNKLMCKHCGLSFNVGDYLDYKPDITDETVTVTKEEAGLLEKEYPEGEPVDTNTVSDQIFAQDEKTYWQVLGISDSDGNGTKETLLIKMVGGTSTTLTLKGTATYNNGPDIMNKIAKNLYSSSKYGEARSIKIDDINNTLEYIPSGAFYYNTETNQTEETIGFNTQLKDLPIETWNVIKDLRNIYTRWRKY